MAKDLDALTKVMNHAYDAKANLYALARSANKPVQVVLHWTAMPYTMTFDDYHINILGDGRIVITEPDFSQRLAHNYCKNTAAIGVTMCCCYQGTTNNLGNYPPTAEQIEVMAQIIAVLSEALDLPIDKQHFPSHGESADNEDYTIVFPDYTRYDNNTYGPKSTCERWDLEVLGPNSTESTCFAPYNEEQRGPVILRGKGAWYRQSFYGH